MDSKKLQSNTIGERIEIARESLKLSKSKLSTKMHLSRSICGQWERGISNPSTAHLVKLAHVLDVSFEWLALGNEVIKPDVVKNETDSISSNTKRLKINQLLDKTTSKQKDYLLELLSDITN
ncbi:MAG: hypothetical protein Rsou_0060 [Candidatus Ruthia sp. Asou_11_S2]|nr:hypothetical protein [Candidatus Ruthia sp. Asou_11_S2]